jgi:FKBP12-rapamycin complex-associated protein
VPLLEFMRDHILAYADNDDKEIRQAAVLACCKASAWMDASHVLRF